MSGFFTVLSHTADTGIAVEADTFAEVLEWAARGMFELMYDLGDSAAERSVVVEVAASTAEDLLVDVLSELLYVSEANDVIPCRFAIAADPTSARVTIGVTPMRTELLHGPPIKAVTYHDLLVEEGNDGTWRARVVFDV